MAIMDHNNRLVVCRTAESIRKRQDLAWLAKDREGQLEWIRREAEHANTCKICSRQVLDDGLLAELWPGAQVTG